MVNASRSLKEGSKASHRMTRFALLVMVPLAVVGGVRAVTWGAATLKTWADGDTLTAADLNGNFAALAAQQTPTAVLTNFNAAVAAGGSVSLGAISASAPKYDLRWMMQHAAAAAACAAASPVGDSGYQHVLLPKPSGVTCAAACAANTGGTYTQCRTSIAVGSILPTQAAQYTDILAENYNYGCNDSQSAYDEVKGQGLVPADPYTAYCCCYK
jgi:hypothetical protein